MGFPIARVPECLPSGANVVLTNANQEYSFTFPIGTHRFTMQPRTGVNVNWAWETGQVPPASGTYFTMKDGAPYTDEFFDFETQRTIYFSSQIAGTVVEIVYWQ